MNVVTSAITTSIVKSCVEITPRSSPMFSTISSVSPRVFISAPIAAESRKREAAVARRDHRADELADDRDRDQEQRQQPELGAVQRVHLGLEAGDDEEERQQDEDDEVLEAPR